MANNDQSGADMSHGDSRFQPNADAVYNRIGEESVLINMKTNQIYELNQTGARFWELLCAGHDRSEIQQLMLQEFDVAEDDLNREIEAMLISLKDKGLILDNRG